VNVTIQGFKSGDVVTILKGTVIKTTQGYTTKTAGKTYKVKINHLLHGWSLGVGYRNYTADGEMDQQDISWHRSEETNLLNALGASDEATVLAGCHEGERYERRDGSSYCHLFVRITPPSIRWAGTGGYWCEVPLTALQMPV